MDTDDEIVGDINSDYSSFEDDMTFLIDKCPWCERDMIESVYMCDCVYFSTCLSCMDDTQCRIMSGCNMMACEYCGPFICDGCSNESSLSLNRYCETCICPRCELCIECCIRDTCLMIQEIDM